jgi:FAD/FMN-containing dehydrogenase/Fe-S oxidoreductase
MQPSARQIAFDAFINALRSEGFTGDIATDDAVRIVHATDNSIYERKPSAVLFPRVPDDLNRAMRAASSTKTALTARGGGTGTNGQSLSDEVVIDCSRYLTRIESIDPEAGLAVVQPGVILDQLNEAAAAHGLFFAPSVSTASRATLGGMVATDASGKGSRVYGRTSDHIAAMDVVLIDGSDWRALDLSADDLVTISQQESMAGRLHHTISQILHNAAAEIARVYPVMNRGLTGYNLQQINENGRFRLTKLLAGSEGTLALTKSLTLRLTRKRAARALVVFAYDDAMAALDDAQRLIAADPVAVEFIDDIILGLAQADPVWTDIATVLATQGHAVRGLLFAEVQADDAEGLETALKRLTGLPNRPATLISQVEVRAPQVIAQLWALRAKCVGLLGRMDPTRQGTAFVEDAAVPPQNLAAFVRDFRGVLDRHGLSYGMFGHADAGCVHVRPALDMRRPDDAARILPISKEIASLAAAHGGLIWGEHGKGLRGTLAPDLLGPQIYAAFCRIKAAFDPDNLLNPGKLATPQADQPLLALDGVPFRGMQDRKIDAVLAQGFEKAVACNGNGQCFNRARNDVMCPSYKATGDRLLSPKGRAVLLREWLRLSSQAGADPAQLGAITQATKSSLDHCLGCKACATQCPVQVDIPAMRARFYNGFYHNRHRPWRHWVLAAMEPLGPLLRQFPAFSNAALTALRPVLSKLGLDDLPKVIPAKRGRRPVAAGVAKAVILVEDSFLGTFDGDVIDAAETLLTALGYKVFRSAPRANGKALHNLGRLAAFDRVARRALRHEARLAQSGLPMVAIEPSVLALGRQEYAPFRGGAQNPVQPIEAFLLAEYEAGHWTLPPLAKIRQDGVLMRHCTEQATDPSSAHRWQKLCAGFGLSLTAPTSGCCGMAGTFGHESEHRDMSETLFRESWEPVITAAGGMVLATGFSCRCQAKRFGNVKLLHPLQALARIILTS